MRLWVFTRSVTYHRPTKVPFIHCCSVDPYRLNMLIVSSKTNWVVYLLVGLSTSHFWKVSLSNRKCPSEIDLVDVLQVWNFDLYPLANSSIYGYRIKVMFDVTQLARYNLYLLINSCLLYDRQGFFSSIFDRTHALLIAEHFQGSASSEI